MLLADYAKLLARQDNFANANCLNYAIRKKLGISNFDDSNFDEFINKPIDSRKMEAIISLAILIFFKHGNVVDDAANDFFWKFMRYPNLWNLHRRINRIELVTNIFHYSFKGIQSHGNSNNNNNNLSDCDQDYKHPYEERLFDLFLEYCNDLSKGEYILDVYVPTLIGYFRGLEDSDFRWSREITPRFIDQITSLLQMELFDIRVILTEIPKGSGANDLLSKHYQIVYLIVKSCKDNSNRHIKSNIKSVEIFLGYIAVISSYLMDSTTLETFLISLLQVLSEFINNVTADADETIIYNCAIAIVNSSDNFKLPQHYFDILDHIYNLLIVSSKLKRERSFEYLSSLKIILRKLAQNTELRERHIDQGSKAIGKCLGILLAGMLELEAESYCESYISNFMTDLPENSRERESFIIMAINVLSNIAMNVKNDKITKICLTSLLIQYRSSDGLKLRRNFYFQFNAIASTLGTSALNNVLDIYLESLSDASREGLDPLQQLILALENLAEICKSNIIKTELFVHFIIKAIVEKALEIIKIGEGTKGFSSSSKRQSIVSSSPMELGLLLSPLGIILEDVNIDLFSSRHALIESFQQVWFILVFFGFQPSLNWPSSWIPFIRIIASKTPILVKERDKIQTESSLFSQLILDRSSNPTLRNFLSNLVSSHSNLIRHLNMAQCLWILSFYMSEKFKLQSGVYEHVYEYISSDIVRHLDIGPVVEVLAFDLIIKWIDSKQYKPTTIQKFASFTLGKLCNSVKSVHGLAKRVLEYLYTRNETIISCQQFWYDLLEKIQNQYVYSKFTLVESISKSAIRDPIYARETFTDLINISRLILNDASRKFPRIFYISIVEKLRQNKKNQNIDLDQNIRDIRIIELLRLCLPKDVSGDQLLDLPMGFIDTPEDYLKWIISEKL